MKSKTYYLFCKGPKLIIMAKAHAERFVTLVDDALTRVDEIDADKVKKKLDEEDDFILLDVREQDEWEASHIAGADYLGKGIICLLYTSPSPRDGLLSRMPSS